MKTKNESFVSLMLAFKSNHDLKVVLSDFLTAMLALVSFDPDTGEHCDEDLYQEIMARYRTSPFHSIFLLLSDALLNEMGDRYDQKKCPDILGEFYQQYISKKNAVFVVPWDDSLDMARKIISLLDGKVATIADRGVTSGRMLMAAALIQGNKEPLYGISHNILCVKMTVINLLFSKVYNAEIMWAERAIKSDFKVSYRMSETPFGVYRIKRKEQSTIWSLRQSGLF